MALIDFLKFTLVFIIKKIFKPFLSRIRAPITSTLPITSSQLSSSTWDPDLESGGLEPQHQHETAPPELRILETGPPELRILETGPPELRILETGPPELRIPETGPPELRIPPQNQNNFQQINYLDFNLLVLAFCLTSGLDIALNSARNKLPLCYEFLSFAILLAFTSLFVARFVPCNNPDWSLGLECAGIFFAATAFFIAMAISFSMFLKIVSCVIYILSLLAIIGSNWKKFRPNN